LLGFVNQDLLQGEKDLLSIFIFSLLVQDFSKVLEFMAIKDIDTFLLLEALECESVLLSQSLEVWSIQYVKKL